MCKRVAQTGTMGLYNWEARHFLGHSLRWREIPKPSIAAVQGQYAAIRVCFDIHQLGHASAYVQSGQFVLTDHLGIRQAT